MTRRLAIVLAVIILVVQGLVLTILARVNSPTTDEAVHLFAGYSYVTHRDYRLNPEHPPLLKTLSGFAVSLLRPIEPKGTIVWDHKDPTDLTSNFFYDSWRENRQLAERFMYQTGNDAQQLIFVGRIPAILMTLALGLIIFLLLLRSIGAGAGVFGLLLYATNPTVLGHGHLITTDISAALGTVVIMVALFEYLQRTTLKNTLLLALALGFGLLTKFTVVITALVVLVAVIIRLITLKKGRARALRYSLIIVPVIWLVINTGYLLIFSQAQKLESVMSEIYQIRLETNQPVTYLSPLGSKFIDTTYNLTRIFLVPSEYYKGLVLVTSHVSAGHSAYFLNQESSTGWWYYFPVILALKHSLALVILAGIGVYLTVRSRNNITWYWFGALMAVLTVSMMSKANLGVRHIMPVIVLGVLWLSSLWKHWVSFRYPIVPVLLVGWIVAQAVIGYPNYLNYFSELIPKNARHLVARDSNLDWGQDIYRIKDYIEKNNISNPVIEYFWNGNDSLRYFGVPHRTMDQLNSGEEAVLIIGASGLSDSRYRFLQDEKPIDYVTPGVLVYRLSADDR